MAGAVQVVERGEAGVLSRRDRHGYGVGRQGRDARRAGVDPACCGGVEVVSLGPAVRYVIQSRESGRFLAPDPEGVAPLVWVQSLRQALGGGVFFDPESVDQVIADHCDRWAVEVVDLDGDV